MVAKIEFFETHSEMASLISEKQGHCAAKARQTHEHICRLHL